MKIVDRSESGFRGALQKGSQVTSWSAIVLVVTTILVCFYVIGELAYADEAEEFLAQPEPAPSSYDGWRWKEESELFDPYVGEGMVIWCWEGDVSCVEDAPPVLHET